jgi:hypothetical protein
MAGGAAILGLGCNGNIVRACDFSYADALLHITSATDVTTGATLGDVVIKDVRFGGVPVTDLRSLVDIAPLAKGVTIEGAQIRCVVSCGFAVDEGRYEFVVSKPGYKDYPVAIDAHFNKVSGDCERTLSRGVEISVQLAPL